MILRQKLLDNYKSAKS